MPPITADFIIAILSLALGAGIAALATLRKLRPEIEKIKADQRVSEAEVMYKLSETMENLMGPMNCEIKSLREGRGEDRERISDLEKGAAEMGKENIALRCEVDELKSQNETLKNEIDSLRRIIDDYRSGRRKPTGELKPVS